MTHQAGEPHRKDRKFTHAETFMGFSTYLAKKRPEMEQYPPTIRGKKDSLGPCTEFLEMEGPGRPLMSDFQVLAFADLMST